MAPTGFHGLLGLFLASRINPKHKNTRIGVVWGSVMPDLDIIGSVLIFIFTGGNFELSIAFHRSITHSLVIMLFLIVFVYIIQLFSEKSKLIYFPFIIGLIGGMLIHVVLDMFYFDGVTLFFPFQSMGDRITIIPFTYRDLSPVYNSLSAKIIGTLDGHFEIVFYLVFSSLAVKLKTDTTLSFNWKTKKIKINQWPRKLQYFSYFLIVQLLFFLILAFLSIEWIPLDRDMFIILLYIPLIPLYILTGILPLLMRNTIYSI